MKTHPIRTLSYADAGVSIDRGNALVERIKPYAERTRRAGVMGGLGGFGALFDLAQTRYRDPVLVSTTDGVGTKLKVAITTGRHDRIGIDLVAMCVNDVLVQGAEPLFFLDYFATGHLDVDVASTVISGIARGCELAGCALIGGETAEMPGLYGGDDYDLAGFCVGVVERGDLIDGSRVQVGDAIIGIASSGPHSNGYSLIRRVLALTGASLTQPFDGKTLGEVLLAPTRIYVKPVLDLLRQAPVHALAHITGGGLLDNLPRVMLADTCAEIDPRSWPRPPVFDWLQQEGNIADQEMYRTFNCGIGMALLASENNFNKIIEMLNNAGEQAWRIGTIRPRAADEPAVAIASR